MLLNVKKNGSVGDLTFYNLGKGCWIYRGYFSNSAWLEFPSGWVIIDTQISPLAAKMMLGKWRKISNGKPILHVINTHHHGDHTGGNSLFTHVPIWASDLTRKQSIAMDDHRIEYINQFGLIHQIYEETFHPNYTFPLEEGHKLVVDGEEILLEHWGRSETDDAIVVHVPSRNFIAAGDAVATVDYPPMGTPFLAEGLKYDGQWVNCYKKMLSLPLSILVPGHGPGLTGSRVKERISLLLNYTERLQVVVKRHFERTPDNVPLILEKSLKDLSSFHEREELRPETLGHHFGVYKCLADLMPTIKGQGWWNTIRAKAYPRVETLASRPFWFRWAGQKILAIDEVLPTLEQNSKEYYRLLERKMNFLFLLVLFHRPKVEGTEFLKLAYELALILSKSTRRAWPAILIIVIEFFGAEVLAQPIHLILNKCESVRREKDMDSLSFWQKGIFVLVEKILMKRNSQITLLLES